ncbi:hypothetical protein [Halomarina litorea]|uniref:hypothetical protein n=1 Tax=Halomarina litorea TaxID=2961595 RepID=UPI0020C29F62|nr:hypothetical protein [Halomarina sp. BCD28]
MTLLLHAGHITAPPPVVRVAIAMVAGFVASVVMGLPMRRLSEGMVPPYTAASILYGKPPANLSDVEARSAHYAAGILAGVLFVLLAVAAEAVVPPVRVLQGGLPLSSHLLAGVGVFAVLYGFFGHVVLPRFGREKREVAGTVRRHWAVSAAVYVLALWVLVVVVTVLVY